jgi:hypothetical protein
VSERRAHSRANGPFEGFWDGSGTRAGRIVHLSVGGCFVESVSPPATSQRRVTVSIVTGSGQVEISGEVIYVEEGQGFAVRFVDPAPDVIAAIEKEVAGRSDG